MPRKQDTASRLADPAKGASNPPPAGKDEPASRKRVSIFLKLFVAFHVIAVTSWTLPNPPKGEDFSIDRRSIPQFFRSVGRIISDGTLAVNQRYIKASPAHIYLMYTGLWQYWDMFSPDPASVDFYGTATITYKSGNEVTYTFPRMYDMSIPKKYISERYRKFYERANGDKAEGMGNRDLMWPTFAQRVALLNYNDPLDPPVRVVLTRHFMYIVPPAKYEYENLRQDWMKAHPHELIDAQTDAKLHADAEKESLRPWTPADYHSYDYYTYTVDQARLQKDKAAGVFG